MPRVFLNLAFCFFFLLVSRVDVHLDPPPQVQRLLNELQTLYAALFCDGELQLAMGELEAASHSGEGAITFEMLKLGFRLGIAAAFALWFMWDCMLQVKGGEGGSLKCAPADTAYRQKKSLPHLKP
jgi:hypothetical protein